jgi:copper resistance protein B
MRRAGFLAILLAGAAGPAFAQAVDRSAHAGHEAAAATADAAVPDAPAPPSDHFADGDYSPEAMAAARRQLRREHGAATYGGVLLDMAEARLRSGRDGYGWKGEASYGGDIDRLVLKSEGEGTRGHGVEAAEAQALYSRAATPYFDLQAGVRQDIEPKGRTYLAAGAEGLLPYWVEVEAAAFLSTRGEVLARVEARYDLRLTQRLILQPRAELDLAAQDARATGIGSGLSSAELGLRLRYEIRRAFAPYAGVHYERRFGRTADYARAAGEDRDSLSAVVGVRAGF